MAELGRIPCSAPPLHDQRLKVVFRGEYAIETSRQKGLVETMAVQRRESGRAHSLHCVASVRTFAPSHKET